MKIRKHTYDTLPYSQENIDKFKSSENMLKHARCNDNTFGRFFVNKKRDELVGYIGCEGDTVVALEVMPEFEGRGYATRLLRYAWSKSVTRLSVEKNNAHAIDVYKHLGYKEYDSDSKMLYMEIKL
jgi:ribosomal protein S18 acetylase RimI-like enzyme